MSKCRPEVTTANEHTGDHPKRFSASVLATSREKVWFGGDEDEPEDWETNRHYLEFESPTNTVSWRLRKRGTPIFVTTGSDVGRLELADFRSRR